MNLNRFFLINVFTGSNALGNQACVLFVDDLEDDAALSKIASDFNLPATSFLKQDGEGSFSVRWFAPMAEIDLCGHGTIAANWAAHRLFPDLKEFTFKYKYGVLQGKINGSQVELKGDPIDCEESEIPHHVKRGFHGKAKGYYPTPNKDIVLFDNEMDVVEMKPDWEALRASDTFGYVITAKSKTYDFVSRVLLPHLSFLEDQATGSAHLVLTPFWSSRLGKSTMKAFQASDRGGEGECYLQKGQVTLKTSCKLFGEGTFVPTID